MLEYSTGGGWRDGDLFGVWLTKHGNLDFTLKQIA